MGKHADLDRIKSKFCEFCGKTFWYNDYAERGGKRVPTYCKDACRVAAFRARKKDENAAKKRASDNASSWEGFRERAKQSQQMPPSDDFRDNLQAPNRFDSGAWFEWIGVPHGSDKATCQAAVRALNRAHHADTNGGVQWKHLSEVNAAWDYLKRRYFK